MDTITVDGENTYLRVDDDELQIVSLLDMITLPMHNICEIKEIFQVSLEPGPSNFRSDDFEIEKVDDDFKLSRENVDITLSHEIFSDLSDAIIDL